MGDPRFASATCPVLTWQEAKKARAAAAERDSVGCVPLPLPDLAPGWESGAEERGPGHTGAGGGGVKAAENGGGLDVQMDSRSGDSNASVVVVLTQLEDEKQQLLRRQQRKKRGGEEDVEEGRHGNRDEEGEREKGEGDGQLSQPSQQWGWQWDASLYCYECNVSPSEMQSVYATVNSRRTLVQWQTWRHKACSRAYPPPPSSPPRPFLPLFKLSNVRAKVEPKTRLKSTAQSLFLAKAWCSVFFHPAIYPPPSEASYSDTMIVPSNVTPVIEFPALPLLSFSPLPSFPLPQPLPHSSFPFQLWRWPRVRHCHKCGRCVDRFDHHCPAIANCVGRFRPPDST